MRQEGSRHQVPEDSSGFLVPTSCPCRRDSDHLHKVRQLYEETEEQIRREKQQLQAQVKPGMNVCLSRLSSG